MIQPIIGGQKNRGCASARNPLKTDAQNTAGESFTCNPNLVNFEIWMFKPEKFVEVPWGCDSPKLQEILKEGFTV